MAGLGDTQSDALRLLAVLGAYEYAGGGIGFCEKHFLRPKVAHAQWSDTSTDRCVQAMEEIHKLRAQISGIAQTNFPSIDVGFNPKIPPPKANQVKALRQLIAASFIDQVAVRKDLVQLSDANGNKYASCRGVAYRANGVIEDVFIHPSSVLFHRTPPDYIVFQEVVRGTKVWIKSRFLPFVLGVQLTTKQSCHCHKSCLDCISWQCTLYILQADPGATLYEGRQTRRSIRGP